MKNWIAFALTVMAVTSSPSAMAQGVFDLGALTSSIGKTTTTTGAKTPSISIDVLNYKPTAQLSAENLKKFYASLDSISPGMGGQLESGLAGQDVFGMLDSELAKYGVRPNNLGDAMAIYMIGSWLSANGKTEDPTTTQVAGVRKMVEETLGKVPEMTKLSDADKQSSAQALLLQLFLNEMMIDSVKADPVAFKKVGADIKAAAKTMAGFDADLFDMTPSGLSRKAK